MDSCQFITFATELKNLLVVHDRTALQVQLIECKIERLDHQMFSSTSDGRHGLTLQLLTKKSVAEGVKKVYQQYRQRKLQEVQKLSALIIQSLQTDVNTNNTEPEASDSTPRSRDNDELAKFVVDDFCLYSRGC